jgi:hypothetical protein
MKPLNQICLLKSWILFFLFALAFSACQKSIDKPAIEISKNETAKKGAIMPDIIPYQFERINEHNFASQGWKEQQVNNVSAGQIFLDESDYVKIICGPENNSDRRLIKGCITMNLPTSSDPTLRRIRLRRGGYSGTLLADLTELKYSTYVVNNSPTIMVLQVDVTGDDTKDFNIWFEPRQYLQGPNYPPLVLNTWQQWNALEGTWYFEAVTINGLPEKSTIGQLVALHPNARIIDTEPVGHNGEGVRFTIGGTPRSNYDNTVGYFDALIIGTKNQQHSTLFDFTCDASNE